MTHAQPTNTKLSKILVELGHSLTGETKNGYIARLHLSVARQSLRALIDEEKEEAENRLIDKFEEIIDEQYELSITDLEREQYQRKEEIPVISKTALRNQLTSLKGERGK